MDDSGDREQKKVHVEESKLGIEDLHLDVGKKYLLCQTRKTPFTALFSLPAALGFWFDESFFLRALYHIIM